MNISSISIFKSSQLYPILDLDFCKDKGIFPASLIRSWEKFPDCISFFQLRAKSLTASDYSKLYMDLKKDFPSANIIINDFWEFAININSFGLHLGKEDFQSLSSDEKSKLRSAQKILKGTSSHSIEDLQNLEVDLWDYSGFGPIFPTKSKKTTNQALGAHSLEKAISISKIPIVPIGGLDIHNFSSIYGFGKILPASISMMGDEKSLLKIVDFIRKHPHPV